MHVRTDPLPNGKHKIVVQFKSEPFGKLKLEVEDAIPRMARICVRVPRDRTDDYAESAISSGRRLPASIPVPNCSICSNTVLIRILPRATWSILPVAQVPIGRRPAANKRRICPGAVPLSPWPRRKGRWLLRIIGALGAEFVWRRKCTVVADAMQRAPVFVFEDARGAREFVRWVDENMGKIREEAEATSSVGQIMQNWDRIRPISLLICASTTPLVTRPGKHGWPGNLAACS